MKNLIEGALDKIRKNRIANGVIHILSYVRADRFFIMILYRWYEKNPTESVKQSYEYFENQKDDIDRMMYWLADEKSRQVWKGMIEFRKTMNYRLHPKKEMPQYFVEGIIEYGDHEVFIDCGGYDGQTSVEFAKHLKCARGGV